MNSSEIAYNTDMFMLEFMGCECPNVQCEKEDYDENIMEIEAMIDYCIGIGDQAEVKAWRRLLQRTKVEKRRYAQKIENNNAKENALT